MARKKSTGNRKSSKRKASASRKATRGGTRSRRSSKRKKSSRSRTSKRPQFNFRLNVAQKALVVGIGIIFLTAVLVLSLLSPNQGQLTAALSQLMWYVFGWGGIFVPLITGAIGLYLVLWGMEQPPLLPIYRLVGLGLLFLVFGAFASLGAVLFENGLNDVWMVAEARTGGGFLGGIIASILVEALGNLGAIFTLIVLGFLASVLTSGVTRVQVSHFLKGLTARPASDEPAPAATNRDIRINPGRSTSVALSRTTQPATTPPEPQETAASQEKPESKPETEPKRKRRKKADPQKSKPQETPAAQPPIFVGNTSRQGEQHWTLPAVSEILEPGGEQDLNNTTIREQVEIIEHTLESFGAPATVVEINQGPAITQFGVEPNFIERRNGKRTKVKVGKIASLADDLTLALAARSIRIQAPVPGKGYVGIEVPNTAKALVSLRDVMESVEFQQIKSPLRIGLGQNVAGQPIATNLAAMPHLLIAGTTGSGKSVCVNSIIACLLLQNTPDNLKIVMVDPKRVELTGYNGIPHLAAPVVVEMDRVIGTLQWAQREMESRYKLFAGIGARNILDYNKKIKKKKDVDPLPYIVIIIDELADLMMLAPEDTERAVTRLAQMARATGIHMVIATQRPSVDVVTGLIKANFPARIAFAVASSTDSRVILDSTGAERLLGQGDMLFQSPDAAAPVRLQGCFASEKELNKLIQYWRTARRFNLITAADAVPKSEAKQQQKSAASTNGSSKKASDTAAEEPVRAAAETKAPAQNRGPVQKPLWEALEEIDEADEEPQYEDELMPEAIALVRKLNKASTSLLQRRFRIGYTRAARLIDTMEAQNIIGPPTGTSKAREVLPPPGENQEEDKEATKEGETQPK